MSKEWNKTKFLEQLVRTSTLKELGELITTELVKHTSADVVALLLPTHAKYANVLAGTYAQNVADQIIVDHINSSMLPASLSTPTEVTYASRWPHGKEVAYIDSTQEENLCQSIGMYTSYQLVQALQIYPLPLGSQLFGLIEFVFAESSHDDEDYSSGNPVVALLEEEQEIVDYVRENALHVTKKLFHAEMTSTLHQRMESMMTVIQEISTVMEDASIVERAKQGIKELLHAEYVRLYVVDAVRNRLYTVSLYDKDCSTVPLDKSSLVGYAAVTGECLNIEQPEKDHRFNLHVDGQEGILHSSILVVPIKSSSGEIHAVISALNRNFPSLTSAMGSLGNSRDDEEIDDRVAGRCSPHKGRVWPFDEEDTQLLQQLSVHIGIAWEKANAFRQVQRQQEINEEILRIVRGFSGEGDILEILGAIVESAYRIANPERVSLYMVDYSRQELWLSVSEDVIGKKVHIDRGLVGKVAKEGKTVLIEDAYSDPRFDASIDEEENFRTKQVLCVPIALASSSGRPIAVLQLRNKREVSTFTKDEYEAMEIFCSEAAISLKRMSTDALFLKIFGRNSSEQSYLHTTLSEDSLADEGKVLNPVVTRSSSAFDHRFQVSLMETFADDTTTEKLHSEYENMRRRADEFEVEDNIETVKNMSSLRNLMDGDQTSNWADNCDLNVTSDSALLSWNTNVLEYDSQSLKRIALQSFHCWNLISKFNISVKKMTKFIELVQCNYHDNPFHNFYHAVETLRSTVNILAKTVAPKCLKYLDLFSMLLAAFCHDIDHPGTSQNYEIATLSTLALRHNDSAILERHHAHTAFSLLQKPECNILDGFSREEYRECRKVIIHAILGTDMSKHFTIVSQLSRKAADLSKELLQQKEETSCDSSFWKRSRTDHRRTSTENMRRMFALERSVTDVGSQGDIVALPFKREKDEDRIQLIECVVHSADLVAQTAPYETARQWGDRVVEEFTNEAAKFKQAGLEEHTPLFMTQLETEYDKMKLQSSFVANIVLPLWENMHELLGGLDTPLANLRSNLRAYETSVSNLMPSG